MAISRLIAMKAGGSRDSRPQIVDAIAKLLDVSIVEIPREGEDENIPAPVGTIAPHKINAVHRQLLP